jgi:hypothetical protein
VGEGGNRKGPNADFREQVRRLPLRDPPLILRFPDLESGVVGLPDAEKAPIP